MIGAKVFARVHHIAGIKSDNMTVSKKDRYVLLNSYKTKKRPPEGDP